jgi:LmbE family N-acetylglucosaminyl deacetylase
MLRVWPTPTALLVGDVLAPQTVASLQQLGLTAIISRLDNAVGMATATGPFSLLMLTAHTLSDRAGLDLVQSLLAISPSARVLLLGREDEVAPRVLIDAMRLGIQDLVDPDDATALVSCLCEQLSVANRRRERVLAIGAHPDDIEIGCGGSLLAHRRRGDRITMLTLSQGSVGGERAARIFEAGTTADAIGAQLLLADLPDTRIDPGVNTIRLIEQVVSQLDPSVVYVHSSHDNHQDHRAVHAATVSSTRGVPRVLAYQSPSATNDFQPSKFIAIDEVVVDKVDVLKLFHSQRERSYLEPEMVIATARYWARHLAPRARFAEPFEVIRSLVQAPQADSAGSEAARGSLEPSPRGLATVTRLVSAPADELSA